MATETTPFLTGGILFSLLLEARKTRIKARAKIKGESDGLSDPDIMTGLIYVITGNRCEYQGDTLGKSTTQYKTCQINSNIYIPFTDVSIIAAYEAEMKCHSASLYKRVSEFMDKFLSPHKHEWFIKAMIETICNDTEIPESAQFHLSTTTFTEKKNLSAIQKIEFQSFLLSVILFILRNRKDNTLGAETFKTWFTRSSEKAQWKFSHEAMGQSITQHIQVFYSVVSQKEPSEYEDVIPDSMAQVIMGSDGIAPDLSSLLNGDIYLIDKKFLEDDSTDDEFQPYMKKAAEFHSRIKTLLYSEKPRLFKDFYVCNDLGTKAFRMGRKNEISNVNIEKLLKISNRCIISGTGGIGKSMMMKHLFFDAVENYEKYQLLPILSSLKDYKDTDVSLIDFAYRTVCEYDSDIEVESLIEKIEHSKCILLLDGYDELTSVAHRAFYNALINFIKTYPDANIIISSRPTNEFIQLGHFPKIEILPFKKEKALELIDKLDFHDPIAKRKFRHDLDTKLFVSHQQFASNPLLLTIMLMTYTSYGEVPAKRHIFYAESSENLYVAAQRHHLPYTKKRTANALTH